MGKNINYFYNYKNTFKEGIDKAYVPIRFNDFISGKTEELDTYIINPNNITDIKEGFRGTIYSNYSIMGVKFIIKNKTKTDEKTIIDIPDHSSGTQDIYKSDDPNSADYTKRVYNNTLETKSVNMYSLYYNTPNSIQQTLKDTLKNTDNYEVSIQVDVGNYGYVEVLHLNTSTYMVEFESNGGSSVSSQEVALGGKVTRPEDPTKKGYKFIGWYKDSVLTEEYDFDDAVTEDITLYAKWNPYSFKIRYYIDLYSEPVRYQDTEDTYAYNTKITAPQTPTRAGYTFKGWYLDSNYTKVYDFNKTLEENNASVEASGTNRIALYAKWEETNKKIIDPKDYTYDSTNNYIDLIEQNTKLSDYIAKLNIGSEYTYSTTLKSTDIIYTGSKIKILKNSTQVLELTNIIRGDINGDGYIKSGDYIKIKNHIMGTNVITDNVLKKAADANNDNDISSKDYIRIKKIVMSNS